MPRKTRMYLPGIPAHVVQRGHNRDACFFSDEDYRFYLERLGVHPVKRGRRHLSSGKAAHKHK